MEPAHHIRGGYSLELPGTRQGHHPRPATAHKLAGGGSESGSERGNRAKAAVDCKTQLRRGILLIALHCMGGRAARVGPGQLTLPSFLTACESAGTRHWY